LQDEEERRLRTERAAEFARQDELDKIEKEKDEKELIKALEAGEGSADKIIKKQKAVALKRSSARMASSNFPPNTETGRPSLLSKYLQFNKSNFSEADKQDALLPEDPISDYDQKWYDYRDLFKLRATSTGYVDQASEDLLNDTKKLAGGFDIAKSVWERATRSAVMGLWVTPLGADSASGMEID
jgi:CDK-activating kinase assembly factor MAT1